MKCLVLKFNVFQLCTKLQSRMTTMMMMMILSLAHRKLLHLVTEWGTYFNKLIYCFSRWLSIRGISRGWCCAQQPAERKAWSNINQLLRKGERGKLITIGMQSY